MGPLFIAGTGTDVGKTYVSAALIRELRARGEAVDAIKPVVSGFDPAQMANSDPAVLLDALGRPQTKDELGRMSPWRYRAPLAPPTAAALEGERLDGGAVIAWCRQRMATCEGWVLIESAGGIMSPLDETRTMLDFAQALAAPLVLVAGSYLGTLSHTLTAAAVIAQASLNLRAVVVSESLGGVELADTVAELDRRLPQIPVIALPRGGGELAALADLLGAR